MFCNLTSGSPAALHPSNFLCSHERQLAAGYQRSPLEAPLRNRTVTPRDSILNQFFTFYLMSGPLVSGMSMAFLRVGFKDLFCVLIQAAIIQPCKYHCYGNIWIMQMTLFSQISMLGNPFSFFFFLEKSYNRITVWVHTGGSLTCPSPLQRCEGGNRLWSDCVTSTFDRCFYIKNADVWPLTEVLRFLQPCILNLLLKNSFRNDLRTWAVLQPLFYLHKK